MSTVAANEELLAAIQRGDVRAVEQALQSGVSPDAEVVEDNIDHWRTRKSLLFLAAEVHLHSLECICVALSF